MWELLKKYGSRFLSVLEDLGNPKSFRTNELKKSVAAKTPQSMPKMHHVPKNKHNKIPKAIYQHKGSGYMGKGSVNTETKVFNHPRKDAIKGNKN